jgi:D-sedoheptulose 7-phosphate isomerase
MDVRVGKLTMKFNYLKMLDSIRNQIERSIDLGRQITDNQPLLSNIEDTALRVIDAYRNNHKVLLAGNGGSAADAQHIAAELVNRFNFNRPGLPALALTTDTSVLTSVGNDYGFEKIFARQLESIGNQGDIFIGISTSGNSANILAALRTCRKQKISTIGFTGSTGGLMKDLCDICILIPSDETPRIQEMHILIGHIICSVVEEELFGKRNKEK